ncbi:M56 family metallopeptidase [Paenibacillus periandrae]|uniref:M56 family metallopeptidase n=1 Tax=Paenibacillus periandrae TaxID=1761741 RepID=UPI001F0984B4|nr:M56 family metallopeptidase [Paenibacillus periandrae]
MMVELCFSLLLMSTVATALYLVFKFFIKVTQKHFTASWIYYSHVLLSTFFLIPYYKLYAYANEDFKQIAHHGLETTTVATPVRSVIQNYITSQSLQEESYAPLVGTNSAVSFSISLLPYVFIAGAFAFIVVIVYQNIRFHRRMFKICEWTDDPLIMGELATCRQTMGVKQEIQVYLSPYISTPFLYGIFKPRIVLAANMEFTPEQYRQIFLHELTHYKRYDIVLKCLMVFINATHWFNPFVYWARRDIDRYCELSCDEKIVPYMNDAERKRYCELLLHVLWNAVNQKDELYSAFSGKRDYLERRISMIMRSKHYKGKQSVRVFTVAILLSVAFISTALAYIGSHNESLKMGDEPKSAASPAGAYVPDKSIILEGEVGTTIRKGDLVFERIVSDSRSFPEQADAILANNSQTHLIRNSRGNEYCTIWIQNAASGHLIFTITKGSPTGTVVPGSIVKIPAYTTWTVSTLNPLKAEAYYANFTSGSVDMSGQVAFTFSKR